MLNLKQKQINEPLSLEHLSSIQSKLKPKKNLDPSSKSNKNLTKDATIIPLKRKNHLPSKSTIENVEHIHYNSPNFQPPNSCNPSSHNFTFTHILQQHQNNKQKSSNATRSAQFNNLSLLQSYSQLYNNNDKLTKNKDCGIGIAFSQGLSQLSVNEQQFSNMLHSKLSAINLNDQRESQLSIEKENRKSPYRIVNTNKLNNTPKIKEKNKNRVKQAEKPQNKTFTALINSNLPAQKFQNDQINLECSEKIQKFMKYQPELKGEKMKFQQKFNEGRNKSNLLSTGLINLSHPSQLTNETRPKHSKQTLSKLVIQDIISEQKVKSFSENSNQKKIDLSQKISQVKRKIQSLNVKKSSQANQEEAYSNFLAEIQQNFNPEMFEKDCLSEVLELQKVKHTIATALEDLICKLKQLKAKLCSDIQEQISLLKTSVQSKINWLAVSNTLDKEDEARMCLIKNELCINRIKSIEEEIYSNCHNNAFLSQNQTRLFRQLNDIQQSIDQIRQNLVGKGKQTDNLKQFSSPNVQGLRDRVEVFWSKVQKLDKIWQMLF